MGVKRRTPQADRLARTLGRQLAAARKAAGYTQEKLARVIGKARSNLPMAETCGQLPDRSFWIICDHLLGTALTARYDEITRLMEPAHGKPGRYQNGCRCDTCRAANAERQVEGRRARSGYDPGRIPHGVQGYINYNCRCADCVTAQQAANARHLSRLQNATLPGAVNTGKAWTSAELALIARDDLSISQMAKILGRTYHATSNARCKVKHGWPEHELAGLADTA